MLVPLREYVEAGFLLSYGPSYVDHCRQAATYVDQILKGAKPADLGETMLGFDSAFACVAGRCDRACRSPATPLTLGKPHEPIPLACSPQADPCKNRKNVRTTANTLM